MLNEAKGALRLIAEGKGEDSRIARCSLKRLGIMEKIRKANLERESGDSK